MEANIPNNKKGSSLLYNRYSKRSITNILLTILAGTFVVIAITPLILILIYVFIKGSEQINFTLFTQLPEPPGDDFLGAGGIGNAIQGTFMVTTIAALIAIPIGIGGGIYLAEYSKNGTFSRFIRFGTNVLSGVPSIIAGVFIYGLIVSTRILFDSSYSAIAGGMALSILMLPTVIKTTDEGLKLVSNDLRAGALGVGASKFITITRITLPSAFDSISTGIVLGLARITGETAPLIFTALFSFYWAEGANSLFNPVASLSVLIYNFALEPFRFLNQMVLLCNSLLSHQLFRLTKRQRQDPMETTLFPNIHLIFQLRQKPGLQLQHRLF